METFTQADIDRFWAKVDKTSECWLWTAQTGDKGYGRFRLSDGMKTAHRVSYELTTGPIPDDMQIDHMCHVRACVNPLHLRIVTAKQNQENRAGAQSNSRSGVRGVHFRSHTGRWAAQVRHKGKRHYFGSFETIAEAESVVVAKRNELFTHNDLDRSEI